MIELIILGIVSVLWVLSLHPDWKTVAVQIRDYFDLNK